MSEFFFAFIIGILLLVDYFKNRELISPFILLATPYIFVILINNLFAYNFGFYKIDGKVIKMIALGLVSFFIGTSVIISSKKQLNNRSERLLSCLDKYHIKSMLYFVIFIETINMIRIIYVIINNGMSWILSNEGYLTSGIGGHLLLILYSLVPILFYYWLCNKTKKIYLFVTILAIILFFTTFVKYHVICFVFVVFLYVVIQDNKYFKQGIIIILVSCISLFILNYLISFIISNVYNDVNNNFYVYHFWKYLAGGLINDNAIFNYNLNSEYSIFYRLSTIIFAYPNMFITGFGGNKVFPPLGIVMSPVCFLYNESSNVIDFIGYMYPSNGDYFEILMFIVVMLVFGIVVQLLYVKFKKSSLNIMVCVVLSFFCFYSFYSVYGTLSQTWEILFGSILIPKIFSTNIKIIWK